MILLVEDNDAVALGLQYGLDNEDYEIVRAASAAEARQQLSTRAPDLILLDIRLPDGNGFDLCREFRDSGLCQPIIMVTARDETIDKVVGLELGADDYLTKPFELRELLARIRSLLRRSYGSLAPSGQQIDLSDNLRIDLASQRVFKGQQALPLTATEFRLLVFLVQNQGQSISREVLLEQVWGYAVSGGEVHTVDVHT